jgi:hypothetical protein
MFLPIGNAPNPKGIPLVTYALIAANVAAFLLLNVPLGSRQADVNDPAPPDYVEVMTRPTAAYQHLRAALETGPRPGTAAAVRQELAAIESLQKRRIGRLHSAAF